MKKQTKIFAIMLAVALVIGMVAVGALAANNYGRDYSADNAAPVAGETIITYADFDSATNTEYAANKTIPAGKGSIKTVNTYTGTVSTVRNEDIDPANGYLQFKNTSGTTSSAYIQMATGTGNTSPVTSTNAGWTGLKTLKTLEFHTLDFDVFFPDGAFTAGSVNYGFQFRAYNASGARKDLRANSASQLGAYVGTSYVTRFESLDGNIIVKATEGYDSDLSEPLAIIDENQWSHFTIVVRGVIVDRGTEDTSDDGMDIVCYTAMNGEIIHTHTFAAPDESLSSKFFLGDMTAIFIQDLRMNYAALSNGTALLDNIALRTYERDTYEGNLGEIVAKGVGEDLTKWDRNAYVPANQPYGKLIAKIGDAEYGHIGAAIAAAQPGDVIEMQASSTIKMVVDKALTFNLNGNTVTGISTAKGFSIETTDEAIVIEKSANPLTVIWGECECGEGCIEAIETEVYPGNNIYDSYKLATGNDPVCQGWLDEIEHHQHVGFEDISGMLDAFDETIIATADLAGETIELVPVYSLDSLMAMRIDKHGNETPVFASAGFTSTGLKLEAGVTIKLMSNVEVTKATKLSISAADITIDLNGYRIVSLSSGHSNPDNRYNLFTVTADGFTLKSSRVGGSIFHATLNNAGTGVQGMGVVLGNKNGITVYFEGQNEQGETTLNIYAAQIFQSYSTTAMYNINGGHYVATGAADGAGMFYARVAGASYSIKDAYFDGGNAVLSFAGYGQTDATCTVNVENCVFGTSKPAAVYTFNGLKINFENCYFGAEVNPRSVLSGATAPDDANATYVYKNCYVADGVTINGTYAAGQKVHNVAMTKEYTVIRNTWNKSNWADTESSIALSPTTVTLNINRMIADENLQPIQAIWYAADGETVLAENTVLPSSYATYPMTAVEGTDGMVVEGYVDWNEDLFVPLGTVGPVEFTLKEGATVKRAAGKIDIMFNFDLVNHLQYTHYIPVAPDGITYVSATVAGGAKTLSSTLTDPATDKEYYKVSSWPGFKDADVEKGCTIVFEYQGQEFTYNAPTVSAAKYIKYVLGAEKYDNMPEFKTAMADLARAMIAVKGQLGVTPSAALTELNEIAAPYMSDAATAIDKTKTADYSAIAEYVESVKVDYTAFNGATIAVTVKEGYAATVKIPGIIHGFAAAGETRSDGKGLYVVHNVRTYGLLEDCTITIYNVADTAINNQVVSVNEGATPVASATVNAEGIINADTAATAQTTAFYTAICAAAKSTAEYMDWRQVWLGKA